jgi:hypothetical protein
MVSDPKDQGGLAVELEASVCPAEQGDGQHLLSRRGTGLLVLRGVLGNGGGGGTYSPPLS